MISLPAKPLVLAALESEVAPLLGRGVVESLTRHGTGTIAELLLPGGGLRVGWSGVGEENAARCARWAAERFKIDWVLLTGYAGAAREGQGPGTIVLASEVRREGASSLVPRSEALARIRSALAQVSPQEGPLHTVSRVIEEPHEKRSLGERGAFAVEMETHAAAGEFEKAGIPWAALRAVLDSVSHSLKGIEKISTPDGKGNLRALPRAILSEPLLLARLIRLALAKRAADRSLALAFSLLFENGHPEKG